MLWHCWLGSRKGIRPVKNMEGWWRWALVSLMEWRPAGWSVCLPLSNATVWLTPTTRVACSNAARMRKPLNFAGVHKLPNRSQSLVRRSSPHCWDMWRTYYWLTSFFPIVDTCLSCEDSARQNCAMVPGWWFLCRFCVLYFQQASSAHFRVHSKFALRPHHV